jgi:hypothetical protein
MKVSTPSTIDKTQTLSSNAEATEPLMGFTGSKYNLSRVDANAQASQQTTRTVGCQALCNHD